MTGNVVQHCRDCKHWEKGDTWLEGYGFCAVASPLEGEARYRDYVAHLAAGELWCISLQTHPDHGCVQWAPKEDEPTANELKWTTREGKIISKSDVPRISDRHLANWLAYLTRRHAEVAYAAAYGP